MLAVAFNAVLVLAVLAMAQGALGDRVGRSVTPCCHQIYLSASEGLVATQEALMGIYTWTGMHNGRPLFTKRINNDTVYFYFKQTTPLSEDSAGWTCARDLSGDSLYFSTRADDFPLCPSGVAGAYDGDQTAAFDATFAVRCHSAAVAKECQCTSLWVNATDGGAIASNQMVFLGKYDLHGAYNGYPVYYMNKFDFFDAYLYFRKQGDRKKDGWTLSNMVGAPFYSVTTGDHSLCPDRIEGGWDSHVSRDDSLSISCVDEIDDELSPTVDPSDDDGFGFVDDADLANFLDGDNSTDDTNATDVWDVSDFASVAASTKSTISLTSTTTSGSTSSRATTTTTATTFWPPSTATSPATGEMVMESRQERDEKRNVPTEEEEQELAQEAMWEKKSENGGNKTAGVAAVSSSRGGHNGSDRFSARNVVLLAAIGWGLANCF